MTVPHICFIIHLVILNDLKNKKVNVEGKILDLNGRVISVEKEGLLWDFGFLC